MADLSSGLDKLPPAERLKRLRQIEADQRKRESELKQRKKDLDEELAKKKKELEVLEKETAQDIETAEQLEDDTLVELTRETNKEGIAELEKRVREFRKGKEFASEGSLESEVAGAPQAQGRMYQATQSPPGFGEGYRAAFDQAEQNIAYLMNAANPRKDAMMQAERELYRSVRQLVDNWSQGPVLQESYAFNKIQEQLHQLHERGPDDSYVTHIANVLNSVTDYRADDARRKR